MDFTPVPEIGRDKDMKHGSLFSGIGGFEEGAKLSGIETIWNVELEKYQRSVLKKHNPSAEQYTDIKQTRNLRYADIISGGFPCQDISVAGTGKGINGSRSGLWSEMYRIVGEVRPGYVIIENSPALTVSGFERVLCDLSQIGYNVEWQCLSNVIFGFPTLRDRIYAIAHTYEVGLQSDFRQHGAFRSIFKKWTPNQAYGYSLSQRIHEVPKSSTVRNGDGFRYWTHRVGAIGNSVNVVVAHYLFECIKQFEKQTHAINTKTISTP